MKYIVNGSHLNVRDEPEDLKLTFASGTPIQNGRQRLTKPALAQSLAIADSANILNLAPDGRYEAPRRLMNGDNVIKASELYALGTIGTAFTPIRGATSYLRSTLLQSLPQLRHSKFD